MNTAPETRRGRIRVPPALRGRHLLVLDIACTIASFVSALALRFDAPSALFDTYFRAYAWAIPLLIAMRIGAFLAFRLYQRVWRYASIDELVAVLAAVVGSSVVAYVLIYVGYVVRALPDVAFPRSVPVVDTVLLIAYAGSWRFAFRVLRFRRAGARHSVDDRALIVGSGTAAISVIRELRSDEGLGLEPIGVVADDIPLGQRLMGLRVLGRIDEVGRVAVAHGATVILLALPASPGRTLRRIVQEAEAIGARCLTVPSVAEVLAGRVTVGTIREVDVEDLLRRAPARIDYESVRHFFRDRTVLVTGAGGSIGSELARQLTKLQPRKLVLLGRGENSIFEAAQTLSGSGVEIVPVILDIRDADHLHAQFRESRPDVVFHAAAHKHVTFMELYPEEAVATNVIGTSNVLSAAAEVGCERLVLISSDKAVNPTSVMGATKRISELLVLDAARRTGAHFATVRFGNVLSSRGSVVPIFKRQLEHGGPLTVTDPEVRRFFMTIPEAVQLVMQASVLAEPGDLFILDMGEPVRIVDLARDLVELNGLEPGTDIAIEYTGLRPGEKMSEELLFPYERSEPTTHEAVRRIVNTAMPPSSLANAVASLALSAQVRQRGAIIGRLRELVPEYEPSRLVRG